MEAFVEMDRFAGALAVKHFRLAMGWTMSELGEKLDVTQKQGSNSAEVAICRWENEKCRVSPEYVQKLILLAYKYHWDFHGYANLIQQFRLYSKIRDHEVTRKHVLNVSTLVEETSRLMKIPALTNGHSDPKHWQKNRLAITVMAAALHDIGKVWIPEHILNKPGKPEEDEMEIIRQHPEQSYICLRGIA